MASSERYGQMVAIAKQLYPIVTREGANIGAIKSNVEQLLGNKSKAGAFIGRMSEEEFHEFVETFGAPPHRKKAKFKRVPLSPEAAEDIKKWTMLPTAVSNAVEVAGKAAANTAKKGGMMSAARHTGENSALASIRDPFAAESDAAAVAGNLNGEVLDAAGRGIADVIRRTADARNMERALEQQRADIQELQRVGEGMLNNGAYWWVGRLNRPFPLSAGGSSIFGPSQGRGSGGGWAP